MVDAQSTFPVSEKMKSIVQLQILSYMDQLCLGSVTTVFFYLK